MKADYGALRARAARTFPVIDGSWNPGSALDASPEARQRRYESCWRTGGLTFYGAFGDLASDKNANETAAEFIRAKIRQRVADPAVAEKLCPRNFFGGKRLCVEIGYFETYNRPNVSLVDLNERPIESVTETGVRDRHGEQAFDTIVLATGFDAMTGAILKIDPRGLGGTRLSEAWSNGPQTYLGLAVAGFPNLFTVTGPTSPSVFTNMLASIEQHVNWITDCIGHLRQAGRSRVEALPEAQRAWMAHHEEVARPTIRAQSDSWYTGANIAGKPRVLMPYIGGFPAYAGKCAEVAARGYDGFATD